MYSYNTYTQKSDWRKQHNNMISPTVWVLCALYLLGLTAASPKTKATKEVLNIIQNPQLYDKEIFPKESGPVDVSVNMYLRGMEIDDLNMRLNVDMTFRMMWRDYRIKFSEPGVQSVRLTDYTKFWLPDPFFKTSWETRQQKSVHPETYIQIDRRGNITFSARFQISSKCVMALHRFPHDRQVCPITIATYGYPTDDVIFKFLESSKIQVPRNLHIANYILESYTTDTCHSKTVTGVYSCLAVYLNLQRNFSIYLCQWYIPCMCFVIIALLSELIEVNALLPRLVLTIGPLLALTASSIAYSSNLTPVPYTKAIDVYTGMSLITIFVTCLHVILGYYYANKEHDPKTENVDEESATKLQKFKRKLAEKGDYWIRIVIVGFYGAYIFLYFLTYGIS